MFDALNEKYGPFTVDAAASEENALCDRHWTMEDDGLAQSWKGEVVWVNPPYSKILPWVRKAVEERHHATSVLLVPASPGTRVWQELIFPYASSVEYLPGRLRFTPQRQWGGGSNVAPFDSAVVVYLANDTKMNREEA